MEIKLTAIQVDKPEPVNFILGQTHFIKSVEDKAVEWRKRFLRQIGYQL